VTKLGCRLALTARQRALRVLPQKPRLFSKRTGARSRWPYCTRIFTSGPGIQAAVSWIVAIPDGTRI
jgi:hypothetical protein